MYSTYLILKPFVNEELSELSLEDLSKLYKQNQTSQILATAYSKIYKLAIVVKNNYWGLNEEDYVSFCLEKLDFCLLHYDIRPNRVAKFSTYFCKVYGNVLRTETEALSYKKRKCILESINELINIGVEDTYDFIEQFLPNTLTNAEYTLCKMESQGYDRKDVAKELDVSLMTIHNMEKRLRVKLSGL